MPVNIEMIENEAVAVLSGEIDQHSAKDIRSEIDSFVERNMPSSLVLDFGGVTFMDSSGIGLVMGRYRLSQSVGCTLALSNTPANIKKIMKFAGIEKIARID